MIEKLLKAKHWQLFTLTYGITLVFQIIVMGTLFSSIALSRNPDPFFLFDFMKYVPLLILVVGGVFFGWIWSVVIGLQTKVPDEAKMSLKRFKIFFFIPIVYLVVLALLISYLTLDISTNTMNDGSITRFQPNMAIIGGFVALILPLHLFSMFCIFHSFYFVAKTIKSVELQKSVEFSDYAGEFFLTWFFMIGVWILQPKINKMVNNQEPESYSSEIS